MALVFSTFVVHANTPAVGSNADTPDVATGGCSGARDAGRPAAEEEATTEEGQPVTPPARPVDRV